MVRFAVCDDNKAELDLVSDVIFKYYDGECEIIKYQNGNNLLADSRTQSFDVLFLDIIMPGLDGMELAKKIREENRRVQIVFVTNKEELAYMGYLYGAFRFVRKSKLETELSETVKSLKKYFYSTGDYILLETHNRTITITVKDIRYFEAEGHYVIMVCDRKERVSVTMKELENKLEQNGFIRIHKSYLVNFRFIYSIQQNSVILTNGKKLPLSRKRICETKNKFNKFMKESNTVKN